MSCISIRLCSLLLMVMAFISCNDRNDSPASGEMEKTFKVAVIMPSDSQTRWNRIAEWALDNISSAQQGLQKRIRIELEW